MKGAGAFVGPSGGEVCRKRRLVRLPACWKGTVFFLVSVVCEQRSPVGGFVNEQIGKQQQTNQR